jgi:hypothetical protein
MILKAIILKITDFYYCCAGWRYIGAFTKVLTMYQIYHSLILPSPLLYPSLRKDRPFK